MAAAGRREKNKKNKKKKKIGGSPHSICMGGKLPADFVKVSETNRRETDGWRTSSLVPNSLPTFF